MTDEERAESDASEQRAKEARSQFRVVGENPEEKRKQ